MQCPVCHAEVSQSAFCTNCGANLSASAPPPAAGTPPPAYSDAPPVPVASVGLAPNTASAIAYLTFIPAVIFLLIEPYNKIPLVRFHSFQSIGLAIFAFIVDLAVKMLLLPISFTLYSMVQGLVTVGLFIIWLVVVLKALKGEWFKLPIIGDLAMKQAQS
jgi:uncharacterized membrane protein